MFHLQLLRIITNFEEIYNPFFSESLPEFKSKSTTCYITENYFIEEVINIKKIFYTDILGKDIIISTLSISHLFN